MTIIKKIRALKSAGILANKTAKDAGPEFDKVNLAYGFNGSGKSTLSRIFGCLQTGKAHRELPEDCSFEVEMSDGKTYGAPDNLAGLETRVCVFNADFVAENLQWSTGRAASIFYISQEQADSAAELKAAEATVPGQKQSRVTEEKAAKTLATAFGNHCRDRAKVLYKSLNMQSRKYEANHLKADYEQVAYEATDILSPEALNALEEVARLNAPLPEVALLAAESFRIAGLAGSARGFAEMSIGATMLEEVQNHPSMVAWLKDGHDYHTDHDLKSCLLCGSAFSAERKALLATALDDKIAKLLSDLEVAKKGALDVAELPVLSPDMWPKAVELDPSLQTAYTEALTALSHAADGASKLVMLAQQTLASRQTTPTQSVQHTLPNNTEVGAIAGALDVAVNAVNALIADHNTASLNFNDRQTKAKEDLRKHWLAEGQAAFAAARDAAEEASKALDARDKVLADLDTKIEALRAKVRTHGPAAETITKLIHNYLGHGELAVVASKEGYELHRHGKLVKGQPSEGEKTAIALCYFLTTLGGDGRALKDLIVVIDDPISSLDSKALNYACTLLLLRLREAGQLIVLTHNWQCMNEFKKAWRRWKKDAALLFLDVTVAEGSTLRSSKLVPMSALLREYDSEYQFLCSKLLEFEATGTAHSPHQFMMPNTMRRVLDVFLAFKVPDTRSFAQKLTKICEDYPQLDTVRIIALERLIQVESHSDNLDDLMGLSPMTIEEVREMNTALLDMIRVADKEHADIIRKIWKPVVAPAAPLPAQV
jgi:wobble nucleotide-excising tRNase